MGQNYQFGETKILPKTGQTTSYPNNNDTDRDDGYYEAGKPKNPRFVDTGNGTIEDRSTGLEWAKQPELMNPHSLPYYNWSMNMDATVDWATAKSVAQSLNGRLPTRHELVDALYRQFVLAEGAAWFTDTAYFWTSEEATTTTANDSAIVIAYDTFTSTYNIVKLLKTDDTYAYRAIALDKQIIGYESNVRYYAGTYTFNTLYKQGDAVEWTEPITSAVRYFVSRRLHYTPDGSSWANSTSYYAENQPNKGKFYAQDSVDSLYYPCLVDHTSHATDTFADDRANNPTYWGAGIVSVGDLVPDGFYWSENPFMTSAGAAASMTWEDGIKYCELLNLSGHGDWRMPNINEFMSLIGYEINPAVIDSTYFPGIQTSSVYWSSTYAGSSSARTFDFSFGYMQPNSTGNSYYVLPVRGGVQTNKEVGEFVFKLITFSSSETVYLDLGAGKAYCTVDWGDGTTDFYNGTNLGIGASHTYADVKEYTITIRGFAETLSLYGILGLTELVSMTDIGLTTLYNFVSMATGFTKICQINAEHATTANSFASGATVLVDVPDNVFNCPNLISAVGAFSGTGITDLVTLGNVPKLADITNLYSSCAGFTVLTKTFESLPSVTNAAGIFSSCTNLTTLSDGILDGLTNITNLTEAFTGDTLLVTIAADLFAQNVKVINFTSVFANSGITSIPATLFTNNILATDFTSSFGGCVLDTAPPTTLFNTNVLMTTAYMAFDYCAYTNAWALPTNLFLYNTLLTNLAYTFRGCRYMTGSALDFIDVVNAGDRNISPSTQCFKDDTALSDYASIPVGWK